MEEFVQHELVPVDHDPFAGPELERTAPTTEALQEIWLAVQMDPKASCAYNESVTLHLKGDVNIDLLKRSIQQLVDRHEGLRTTFSGNGASINIANSAVADISEVDLSKFSEADKEKKFNDLIKEIQSTPFDIVKGPLFTSLIVIKSDQEVELVLTAHHLVCDGWSMGIMMADLSKIYSALVQNEAPHLDPPDGFCEYAVDQMDLMASEDYKVTEAFWLDQFKGKIPEVDLPTDRPRPEPRTYEGTRIDEILDPEIAAGIKKIGTDHASSFVTTLLSIFEVYLSKLTGQDDIVLALPAAGQSDSGKYNLVGHCVNFLALRSKIDLESSFVDHLKERKKGILDAFDHQRYTFGSLLKKLAIPRSPGRIPLVPVVFNIDMNMDDGVVFEGIEHDWTSNPRRFENFELYLNATGSEGKLILEWSYKTDLFDEGTIRSMMDGFRELLKEVIADPNKSIKELIGTAVKEEKTAIPEVASTEETGEYIPASVGKVTPLSEHQTVAELFAKAVQDHKDKPALLVDGEYVSYKELDQRSDQLAHYLVKKGVVRDQPVGLAVERSTNLIIAVLAMIKSGGAYVPIDPDYPEERIRLMVEDSKTPLILTQRSYADIFAPLGIEMIEIDTIDLEPVEGPPEVKNRTIDDLMYVIYTSGSTGRPKGVAMTHGPILNLINWQTRVSQVGEGDKTLQFANIDFDVSIQEIFSTFKTGGIVALISKELRLNAVNLLNFINENKIDRMILPFVALNFLADAADRADDPPTSLKEIYTSGEQLKITASIRNLFKKLDNAILCNQYGPTECHVVTEYTLRGDPDTWPDLPPIGTAVDNVQLHLLDEEMKGVPAGTPGEVYLSGRCISRGYLNNPERTNENFIPDPFNEGGRLYKVGDLVYVQEDGNLIFQGRIDDQVKVRGYRIELGEVEVAMSKLDGIDQAAANVYEDRLGENQLVGYLVGKNGTEVDVKTARAQLENAIPGYMMPTAFVVLDELPLYSSGKTDRNALPAPDIRTHDQTINFEMPRDHLERRLASIWSQLLGVEKLGIHDNFFELGGHSLMGISMFEQIKKQFDQELSLSALFQSPTVAKLAAHLKEGGYEQKWANLAPIRSSGSLPPFFCVHGDEANYFIPRYLGEDQPFYAFFHQGEDGTEIKYTNVEDLAAHFIRELKTVKPHGPYYLAGYSFGGCVAYEMAQQLKKQGEEIGFLGMFDTSAPREYARTMDEERLWYDPLKKAILRPISKRYLKAKKILPPKLRHWYIIDTYDKAIHAYKPEPFDGEVHLFRAIESGGDEEMGWGEVAREVKVHHVPGDHFTLIKEPDVRVLAEKLAEELDKCYSVKLKEAV